jgi:hypothetical protein
MEGLVRDLPDPDEPHDPYAQRWRRLEDAILRSVGALDAEVRAALAGGRDIPEPLSFLSLYVEKVTRHAYRVTDDDVQALLAAGNSQDQIFEATLAAALGAAQVRLRAGLVAARTARDWHETSEMAAAQAASAAGEEREEEE